MNLSKLVLIAVCVSAFFLSGCEGEAERKASYLEKGKKYLEEENYEKAKIELKNVLQIDPKHAEAYFLFGSIDEKEQNWSKVFGNYSKAVELNPDLLNAREGLGRLQLLSGNTDKAVEQMEAILVRDPDHLGGRRLKAAIMDKNGDQDGAIKEANEVFLVDPSQWQTAAFLSTLYTKKGDDEKAVEVLEKAISATVDNIPLRVELARLYADRKELNKAAQFLRQIITIKPEEMAHYFTLAAFYAKNKLLDESEAILREAIKVFPGDEKPYLLLARLLFENKKKDQSVNELLVAIEAFPEKYSIHLTLADVYRMMNKSDEAIKMYRKIIELNDKAPNGIEARNRLAFILLLQGNADEAARLTEEVLEANPKDYDALLFKGKLALKRDDALTAINVFRSISKDRPDSAEVANLLALSHLRNDEPELAKETMRRMVEVRLGDVEGKYSFANYLVRIRDYDEALKVVGSIPDNKNINLKLLELKTFILGEARDEEGLIKTLQMIKKEYPDDAFGYQQMGFYLLTRGKYDDALQEFEQALEKSPNNRRSLTGIIRVYLSQGKKEEAIARLSEILAGSPDATAHQLLAEIYVMEKKYKDAEINLVLAKELDPEWVSPYNVLAHIYQQTNVPEKAVKVYEEIIQLKGTMTEGLTARIDLAKLLLGMDQWDKANTLIEGVLIENPRNRNALYVKAAIALKQRDTQAAIKILRMVTPDQPDSLETANLLATAYVLNNEIELAKETYTQLLNANPTNVSALLSASSFFVKYQYDGEALQQVEKLLGLSPGNIEALIMKTTLLMKKQDFGGVKSTVEDIIKTYPDDPFGYLHMGKFYQSQKKFDKALEEFETAVEKAPKATEPLAAIVKMYMEQGQHDKAVIRLKQTIKTYPDHSVAYNLLGEVYVAQKKTDEAIVVFRKAIDLNPKWTIPYGNLANLYIFRNNVNAAIEIFQKGLVAAPNDAFLRFSLASAYENAQQYDKAVAMYKEILGNSSNGFEVTDAATNNLAMILAGNIGDAQSLKKALELIKGFENSPAPAFLDTAGWVHLKAGNIDKAISILTQVIEKDPKPAIFQYHLGLAYYNKGNNAAAKEHLGIALSSEENFPGKEHAAETLKKIP